MKRLKNTAMIAVAAAGLAMGASAAQAHSVYAYLLSTDGAGTFTYQIQFSNTDPTNAASIFAKDGGLTFNSFPGFISASINTVQFDSATPNVWKETDNGLDSATFTYSGALKTNVSGTNLLTVNLKSSITSVSAIKNIPTVGHDWTDQNGSPGLSQYNTGNVEGPGVGSVVPLPAAAWAGLSLLGGMGALGALRRKRLA